MVSLHSTWYPSHYWWYPSTVNIVHCTDGISPQYWISPTVLNIPHSTDGFPPQNWPLMVLNILHSTEGIPLQYWRYPPPYSIASSYWWYPPHSTDGIQSTAKAFPRVKWLVSFKIPLAISSAACVQVGYHLGAAQLQRAKDAGKAALILQCEYTFLFSQEPVNLILNWLLLMESLGEWSILTRIW